MFFVGAPLILAAALAQAPPPEAKLLDVVPAEADVVVRVSDLEKGKTDLVAMIKAMSPTLAKTAEPAIQGAFDGFKGSYGDGSVGTPFLTLIRIAPGDAGAPPWAVVVLADNTDAVLNGLAGGKEPELKNLEGGVSSFAGPDGSTWYTASGTGLVAFGPDKTLIAKVASPATSKVIAPGLRAELLKGDLGAYVNLSALVKRYKNEIEQARDTFMGALDQAGAQAGNAQTMDAAKKIYGVVFDSVGDADSMALSLDFAAERLVVSGQLVVKAETGAARWIAGVKSGDAATLATLSADSSYYMYMNLDGKSFTDLQNMGVAAMVPAGGKLPPELEKALARQKALGAMENTAAISYDQGMRGLTVMKTEKPAELLDSSLAVMKEMKGDAGLPAFIKGFELDPETLEYRDYTFRHITVTMDFDKMPGGATGPSIAMMKSMFGGDTMNMWYGSNGEQVVQVMAKSQDEAQEIFDSYLDGTDTVGATDSFRSVRDQLPKAATFLGMFSAQGIVKQIATQMATVSGNPNLKPPGDLPKQPVLMGGSLGPAGPNTVEFRFVLPSAAGPVFEKGFVPLIQGMQGRVDQ